MADQPTKQVAPAADGDVVETLSIRKDGTPDQHNPRLINRETALAATKEQFAQMAVAKVDDEANRKRNEEAESKQDPTIEARSKEHDAAVKAAEAKAEQVVKALT